MITDELSYRILQMLGHQPTSHQQQAINEFCRFLSWREDRGVFILRGSAGTGKTTLAAAIVQALSLLRQRLVLLAPTGRAAKVFSLYAHHPAYTIHRRIYRQLSAVEITPTSSSLLAKNLHRSTLFIVDEASMISPELLSDLVHYVYEGEGCQLVLIGDSAQLPPVGQTESPALSAHALEIFSLRVFHATLSEVVRQQADSGILYNATQLRSITEPTGLPHISINGFDDLHVVPGDELIESLASSYSHAGLDDTIVVTRSNKRANIYNQGIRSTILDMDEVLCRGERLMIVKNNYYWKMEEGEECSAEGRLLPEGRKKEDASFIANGDIAVVQRVRHIHEQHGFHFAEVTMQFPDYDDCELTATVLLDTLTSEAPALTTEQQEQLFQSVMADYADLPLKADRLRSLKTDRYYNALQVKYAYAVTCHKAQGGQWAHVYLDQGYLTDDMLGADYLHWLYTAFTRATEHLYLVNWPQDKVKSEE